MLENLFKIHERKSTIGHEISGGVTTFLTMCYIIFVQPALLSAAGMDRGAVMVATCVSAGLATILMGILANYPIALAPAMGHNAFFAFVACGTVASGGFGLTWQQALGANFVSGALFLILSFFGFRAKIMRIVPPGLRLAIAAGIGLLITLLGLQWAGIVVDNPAVYVGIGDLTQPACLVSIFGLALAS
ncbi:MAG: solute carrier family 23 protein, partial [Candidatus Sumerlaeota bacterium]